MVLVQKESPSVRASYRIFAKGACKAEGPVLVPARPLKHLLLFKHTLTCLTELSPNPASTSHCTK